MKLKDKAVLIAVIWILGLASVQGAKRLAGNRAGDQSRFFDDRGK